MVLGILSFFGVEYELVLGLRRRQPSLPPPTFDTTLEPVEPQAPALARALPSNVRRLPRRAA